jgi:hypothetical protein
LLFLPESYGPDVSNLLALDGSGVRPMDLFPHSCTSENARETLLRADPRVLFPTARDPESALSGLFLYFSCLKEAHDLLHHFDTVEGAYWHGIMHRMEGDAYNAGYWFRRIGEHPVFPALARKAGELGYANGRAWDPLAFIRFCEASSRTKDEDLARRVQLAEWQLLFDYCAAPVCATADNQQASPTQQASGTARR